MKTQNKKNLVIASDCYLPRWDGIARFLSLIIPKLKNKFNVTVIAPDFDSAKKQHIKGIKEILMDVRNYEVGDYQIPVFSKKKAKEIIKNADIVWTQSIGPIGAGSIKLAKRYNKKTIAFIHSVEWELFSKALGNKLLYKPISKITRRYIRKLYSKCDLLMVPSEVTADLFNWYKIKTEKVITPLGIDTKLFSPAKEKIKSKEKLNLKPDWKIIGYVGRLAHEKDIKTLVRAFLRLRDQYDEKIKLLVVGSGLKELENRLNRMRGVIMAGSQDDVVPYYRAMDVYVMPSLTETTSLSTLEAMSCGLTVIATPVGDIKNYIKNSSNGLIFQKSDSYELSCHIQDVINDSKLRNKLAINARKTVIEKFSWKKASEKIVKILDE